LLLALEMVEVCSVLIFRISGFDTVVIGKPSEVHKKCLEEVQSMSRATLFSPVTGAEAVQAMSTCSLHVAGSDIYRLQYWSLVGPTTDG
jgi:hypothetical protein